MESDRISHYELVRLIGRGGMGEVYEAIDLHLRRRVALKFLSPELAQDADALARFEREALAAAELNHPHIATVYAFDRESQRPFIAMELLAGPSLRERLQNGPLPIEAALAIARDVAAALAYAHRRGTSHRDIKPENLMFDEHGEIKIMDFGLARASMATRLTVTGTQLGTPAYMSPEALRGETGPASDAFALGLCLYEMLAGLRAYAGDNAMAVMFSIANESPKPLHELRPETPESVTMLIDRLIAKDPAQRMDAATAARELSAMTGVAWTGAGASAAASVRAGAGVAATPPEAASSLVATRPMESAPRPRRRRAAMAWTFATLGLAVAAALGLVLQGNAARRRGEAERIQLRAVQYQRAGDRDRARGLYLDALRLDPGQAGALTNLAMLYQDDSLFTTADSLFRAVLAHHPRDAKLQASAYYNLGSNDLATAAYPSAVEHLRQAFALDSSYADVYNNLGLALIENGQLADALTTLRRGVARFPGVKYLYKNAGRAAFEQGDRTQALRYLDRALQLDPQFSDAQALRARVRGMAAATPVH